MFGVKIIQYYFVNCVILIALLVFSSCFVDVVKGIRTSLDSFALAPTSYTFASFVIVMPTFAAVTK